MYNSCLAPPENLHDFPNLKKKEVEPAYEWTHVQRGRVETLGVYDTCFNGEDQKKVNMF